MKFDNFYEAWWFLNECDTFKMKEKDLLAWRRHHNCICHAILKDESWFCKGLDIDVQKVNPKTNCIDDNDKLNTKVEVWLECGEPFYNEDADRIDNYHNIEFDCGSIARRV